MSAQRGNGLVAGVNARLRNHAAASGQDVARVCRQVAFQRVLARLAPDDRWVLKGGFALEVRLPLRARATRDLDLALTDAVSVAELSDLLDAALDAEIDADGFTFVPGPYREIAPDDAGNRRGERL